MKTIAEELDDLGVKWTIADVVKLVTGERTMADYRRRAQYIHKSQPTVVGKIDPNCMRDGLSKQVSDACDRFFISRGMPLYDWTSNDLIFRDKFGNRPTSERLA